MKFSYLLTNLLLSTGTILTLNQPANATLTSNLTVEIEGLSNTKGQVCFSLFSSGRGFPDSKDDAVNTQCVKITDKLLEVTFDNLQPQTYAVAVFWDDNEDGELNRNFLGIPTEKFGFSSNPVITTGPPKFGDSAVIVVGKNTRISIQLRSLI
ncbi:DUF2141 domain-containing protein [Crocosphaera sp. Alani8]|uniref:DUF2141 domain-containing protein n=1 Tax=Crocosphaera sp. Alani8 TaxID=3038952 RepID=UPI00313AAF42